MVIETEAADQPGKGQKITLPCEIAGRFYPHGDHDVYFFDAAKGDAFWFEIFSERLGQPTSPELLIQKVGKSNKGEEQFSDVQDVGGPDMQPMQGKKGGGSSAAFTGQSRDIEYRFECKGPRDLPRDRSRPVRRIDRQRGPYLSHVDPQGIARFSPRSRRPRPSPIPRVQSPSNPTSWRPSSAKAAQRRFVSISSARTVSTAKFMSRPRAFRQAFTAPPRFSRREDSYASLLLTADENAESWVGSPSDIVGKAKIGDEEKVAKHASGAVVWPSASSPTTIPKRALPASVADLSLAVSCGRSRADFNRCRRVKVRSQDGWKAQDPRHHQTPNRDEATDEASGRRPAQSAGKLETTIAADAKTGSLDLDIAALKLQPGTYTFYLQALVQVKYERKACPPRRAPTPARKRRMRRTPRRRSIPSPLLSRSWRNKTMLYPRSIIVFLIALAARRRFPRPPRPRPRRARSQSRMCVAPSRSISKRTSFRSSAQAAWRATTRPAPRPVLILETPADIRKGGEDGAVVIPGNERRESKLLKASTHAVGFENPMPPPNNKVAAPDLTPAQLGLIRLWIDQGAKWRKCRA